MSFDRSTAPAPLRSSSPWSASVEPTSLDEAMPESVGRYRVIGPIGGGGQGVVYEAHDPELCRRVAVKLLRRGTHRRDARVRLLREANALAQLSHPNVVGVNDVGECADGVYVVTQLVPGVTLARWLDTRREWRDVVRVFVAAGRGLEAAHRSGIVHRDFKPANVLVGDDGIVRLVDFGLARDAPDEEEHSGRIVPGQVAGTAASGSLTQPGFAMGTPAYMAPEQHDSGVVTAAADQYAYCVALFEGLWGQRPFAGRNLNALAALKNAAVLPPAMRGDGVPRRLREIVTRGLEPRPERRWPSMSELVHALEQVAEPSRRVRPIAVAAGAVIVGLGWSAWPSGEESRTCAASRAWSEVWNDARAQAIAGAFARNELPFAADAAGRVRAQLDAFGAEWVTERESACTEVEVERAADVRIACLDAQLQELEATLVVFEQAEASVVERAVATTRALPDPRTCRGSVLPQPNEEIAGVVAEARAAIVRARALERAGRFDDARGEIEDAEAKARELGFAPLEVEAALAHASILSSAADTPGARRRAEQAYLSAQSIGYDEPALRAAMLAAVLAGGEGERKAEAHEWLRRADATLDRLGADADPELVGELAAARAEVLEGAGEYVEALEVAREGAAILEAELGADDPRVAAALSTVSNLLRLLGRAEEAEAEGRRAVEVAEAAVGPDHPETGMAWRFVALALKHRGEFAEALEIQLRVLAIGEAAYGPDSTRVAGTLLNIGVLHSEMGRAYEAEAVYRRALEIQTKGLGRDHVDCARTLHNLAITLRDLGKWDEAIEVWSEALAIGERHLGPEHPLVAAFLGGLGAITANAGKPEEGLAMLERSLAIHEKVLGSDHPMVADTLARVAYARRAVGDVDGARRDIDRAIAIGTAAAGADHPDVARMRYELANVLADQGQLEEAIAENEAAMAAIEQSLGRDHTTVAEMLRATAGWKAELGHEREAARVRERADAIMAAVGRGATP